MADNNVLTLATAYKNVFGSKQGQIVLLDLLSRSGYTAIQGPESTSDRRAFADGARFLMAHILMHVNKTDSEMIQLHKLARATDLDIDDE